MVLLARKDEEGNTQALYDHLHGAGRLASGFEDELEGCWRLPTISRKASCVSRESRTVQPMQSN